MNNQFVKIFTYNGNQVVVKKEAAPNNSIYTYEMRENGLSIGIKVKCTSEVIRNQTFDFLTQQDVEEFLNIHNSKLIKEGKKVLVGDALLHEYKAVKLEKEKGATVYGLFSEPIDKLLERLERQLKDLGYETI